VGSEIDRATTHPDAAGEASAGGSPKAGRSKGSGAGHRPWLTTLFLAALLPAVVFGLLSVKATRDALLPVIHPRGVDWGKRESLRELDRRQPFIDRVPNAGIEAPRLVRLSPRRTEGGWLHEVFFWVTTPPTTRRPSAVAFHFVQPTAPVSFRTAELATATHRVTYTRSDFERFEVRPRFVEHVIEFPWPSERHPVSGELWALRVTTENLEELDLWTRGVTGLELESNTGWFAVAGKPALSLMPGMGWSAPTSDRSRSLAALLVEGHVRLPSPVPETTRLSVLAWVWGFQSSGRLSLLIAIACSMAGLGIALWPGPEWTPWTPARTGLATGGMLLGLAMVYAMVIPPFQAPDEPEHFISFAKGNGATNLIASGREVAARAQLERLAFRPDQKLRPDHLYASDGGWSDSVETVPSRPWRSGLGFRYWQGVWAFARWMPPQDALLVLRLSNSVVAAVCLGLTAFLLARSEPNPKVARGSGMLWLTVPTLPFFMLCVSNYSVYLSTSILAAGCLVATVLGGRRDPLNGFFLGLALGCVLHVSRGSIPLFVAAGIILLIDSVLPAESYGNRSKSRLPERLFLLLGLLVPRWLTTEEYDSRMGIEVGALLPSLQAMSFGKLLLALGILLTVLLCLGDLIARRTTEMGSIGSGGSPRQSSRHSSHRGKTRWVWLAVTLCVGAFALFPSPETPWIQSGTSVPVGRYGLWCLASWFTSFGFTHQDFATFRSFWGGFGWFEFSLPRLLMGMPALLWVAGWSLGLSGQVERRRGGLAPLRAVVFGLAIILGLLSVFVAAQIQGYSVRGRYLFPMNMMACAFASVWLARGLTARLPATLGLDRLAVLGTVIAIHLATLGFVLARYL
jgi:hypothetical protein